MNASFDGRPVRLHLESSQVVLLDPLALDGVSQELTRVGKLPESERHSGLQALSAGRLRIGVQTVDCATHGLFQVAADSFQAADANDTDPAIFDVDTGAVVIIDMAALSAVASAFTWDRYDALLRAPVEDNSILVQINADVGGPRFAVFTADADSPFGGDGSFRLKPNGIARVA